MTVDEERNYALKLRYPELAIESRGYGLIAQTVFFVLTAAGIAAFYFWTREAKLATALLCIVLAEFLILGRKWFYTGVEAALWLGGLFAALQMLPSTGAPEANLLIAAAFAVAGVRVRQPLFGGAAAYFVANYLEVRFDLGTVVALLMAAAALFALYRTWNRPSTEWLFAVIAVGMPFAGWAFADSAWLETTLILYSAFAVLAFVSAVRKRHHAMFASAAAAAIVAGVKSHELLHPPHELTFALAGLSLLVLSLVVTRLLRGRTRGFVVDQTKPAELEEGLEILGTLGATTATPSAGNPPEQRSQDDGGFGGAGATGSY
jgi:hypothetical protein